MTREEQIEKESKNRYPYIKGLPQTSAHQEIFIEGAKWADANPNKKLVYTKKELLDMGFAFDLNGNICNPQEIEESTKKYINFQKDKWIKNACEWLDVNFPTIDCAGSWYKEGFIKQFKKAMDE